MRKFLLTFLCVAGVSFVFAQQNFKYAARLPKIDSSAFYKIKLQPALLAKCNAGLSDLRITDEHNKFVPFLFGSALPVKGLASFVILPQINSVVEKDTISTFVVENTGSYTISQLYIQLRNTSVRRTVDLSGSDDNIRWFAIKENIELTETNAGANGTFKQSLNFPASTYRYFKISINHKNREPVAILQAGVYKQQSAAPLYLSLPVAKFTQKDSANTSYIHVSFNDSYAINKLHFKISGSKYYQREMNIYAANAPYPNLVFSGDFNSVGINDILLSAKTKTLNIEIINGDNPPLAVTGIDAYQLSQTLISYLEKGKEYHLLFGDSTQRAPDYDLKFFTDSLQHQLAQADHGLVTSNPLYHIKQIYETKHLPEWVIWISIIAALLILGLLTLQMTKEVKKKAE